MKQLMILDLPAGYLPCSNPHLVSEYKSIKEILEGSYSSDFPVCDECEIALCEHHLDEKREDDSYKVLVQHFRNGGMINQPILWQDGEQSNGHHRLTAAYDAGFTHIPVRHYGWGDDDWTGVHAEKYGFRVIGNGVRASVRKL